MVKCDLIHRYIGKDLSEEIGIALLSLISLKANASGMDYTLYLNTVSSVFFCILTGILKSP